MTDSTLLINNAQHALGVMLTKAFANDYHCCALDNLSLSDEQVDNAVEKALEDSNIIAAAINIVDLNTINQKISLADMAQASNEQKSYKLLAECYLYAKSAVNEILVSGGNSQIIHIIIKPKQVENCFTHSYCTGLFAFSRSIAKEYGRKNIRANNLICTDSIETTEVQDKLISELKFLLGSQSAFISGEQIIIKG